MSQQSGPRKFKVEPLETTTKTSRKFMPQPLETTTRTSRKFMPEPLETTQRSSKPAKENRYDQPNSGGPLPQPTEVSERSSKSSTAQVEKPTPRRFAPQPIESTVRSSKNHNSESTDVPSVQRIIPEPIQTVRISSKDPHLIPEKTAPRRFAPQLIEGSTERRRRSTGPENVDQKTENAPSNSRAQAIDHARRRFTPELIDTAKRTRRAGDSKPAHLLSDRTDAVPLDGAQRIRPSRLPVPPDNTPLGSPNLSSAECRRLGIPPPRRQSSNLSSRPHCFRAPTLEPIDSSESGEDSDHSSDASSTSSSSDISYQLYKHATRMRESIDATSSGYMLQLAAKAAERQLRDQALAAFSNDDQLSIRVNHYIGHDSEDSHTSKSTRSEYDPRRFGSINWELKDMRRHHETLEGQRAREQAAREARKRWHDQYEENSAWRNPFKDHLSTKPKQRENPEMERMRKKARPPMLGSDIAFPRCSSPEPARFDVTQGTYNERTAMCYLTEQSGPGPCGEGLWAVKAKKSIGQWSMRSQANSTAPSRAPSNGSQGLWGGMCRGQDGGLSPGRGPTGLLTPRLIEDDVANPFDSIDASRSMHQLPPSPPPSNSGIASLDEKLELEHNIAIEYTDDFVTQVYNYLSLGYPSIARRYDEELGKIARVPVSDLRHDDELDHPQGYIRLGEDGNARDEGIKEEMCGRWKALKLYIHEWARQHPNMCEPTNKYGGFGVAVRRGSWAW